MRIHLTALAILAGVILFLLFSATDDNVREMTQSELALTQEYDYYMAGVESTRFRLDGRPGYRISARRLTHYPDPDHTLIDDPNFLIYREQASPWRISAESGRVEGDLARSRERMELRDNVVIHRVDSQGRAVNIYTEYLTVYPDSREVSTDRQVRIETSGSVMTSTGMHADLNSNRITLSSNVHGTYAPAQIQQE